MDSLLKKIYSMTKEEMTDCAKHLMLGGGTRGGPILKSGKGVRVFDVDGNPQKFKITIFGIPTIQDRIYEWLKN